MPSLSIVYFSQTGTTKTIAGKIAEGISKSGVEPKLFPMTDVSPETFAEADILGIGLPVYMFRPPFLVMDFLKKMPSLEGKAFFTFVLYGTHPGSTATTVRKSFVKKGARDLGLFYSTGEDMFAGYLSQKTLFSPDRPSDAEKESAEAFGTSILERYNAEDLELEEDPNRASIPDLIERAGTHRLLAKHVYRHMIVSRDEHCNSCGLCAKLCPNGNITMVDGKPKLGKECLLCLTCELKCPHGAFWSPFTSWVFAPVMMYNVWQGKYHGVEHVPVTWERGKVKRTDDAV